MTCIIADPYQIPYRDTLESGNGMPIERLDSRERGPYDGTEQISLGFELVQAQGFDTLRTPEEFETPGGIPTARLHSRRC